MPAFDHFYSINYKPVYSWGSNPGAQSIGKAYLGVVIGCEVVNLQAGVHAEDRVQSNVGYSLEIIPEGQNGLFLVMESGHILMWNTFKKSIFLFFTKSLLVYKLLS